jgi:hypothetical protein
MVRALILRYYSGIGLERLEKTMKNISQDDRSPGRDLNPESPEHEEGLLTAQPRRSVVLACFQRKFVSMDHLLGLLLTY